MFSGLFLAMPNTQLNELKTSNGLELHHITLVIKPNKRRNRIKILFSQRYDDLVFYMQKHLQSSWTLFLCVCVRSVDAYYIQKN